MEIYGSSNNKILIAESDVEVNSYLTAMCRLQGYAIFNAFSPQETLSKLEEIGYMIDVICLDGKIASDKGVLIITRVKKANENIKILVVANDRSSENIVLNFGADIFIVKPVSGETILSSIGKLLLERAKSGI